MAHSKGTPTTQLPQADMDTTNLLLLQDANSKDTLESQAKHVRYVLLKDTLKSGHTCTDLGSTSLRKIQG